MSFEVSEAHYRPPLSSLHSHAMPEVACAGRVRSYELYIRNLWKGKYSSGSSSSAPQTLAEGKNKVTRGKIWYSQKIGSK